MLKSKEGSQLRSEELWEDVVLVCGAAEGFRCCSIWAFVGVTRLLNSWSRFRDFSLRGLHRNGLFSSVDIDAS